MISSWLFSKKKKDYDPRIIRYDAKIAELRASVIEKSATIIAMTDDFNRIGNICTGAFEMINDLKTENAALRARLSKYESVEAQ